MSTSYTVLKTGTTHIELDERSNRFSLDIDNGLDAVNYGDFTPEEIIGMALEMLKTASYWTDLEVAAAEYISKKSDKSYYLEVLKAAQNRAQ